MSPSRRCFTVAVFIVAMALCSSARGSTAEAPETGGDPFAADRFTVQPGMRTVCVASRSEAATGKGCFDVYTFTNEKDPQQDYVIWRFIGRARPTEDHRVQSVRVGVRSSVGQLVNWDPPEDRVVAHAEDTPVLLDDDRTFSTAGVATGEARQLFRVLPGTVHPDFGDNNFEVRWSAADGKAAADGAEVGGGGMWAVPQGSATPVTMPVRLMLEFRAR